MFLDVVGGALLERGLVEPLAPVPGHQDEWLAGTVRLCVADQLEPRPVGQALIDEVDIVRIVLDPLQPAGGSADHFYRLCEARIGKRHLEQGGRLRIVVHDKDANDFELAPIGTDTSIRTRQLHQVIHICPVAATGQGHRGGLGNFYPSTIGLDPISTTELSSRLWRKGI